jgi:hypothetical protein
MAPTIYIHKDGQQIGPFTEKEMRSHWANGSIGPDDLAWYEGLPDWVYVKELFGVERVATVLQTQKPRLPAVDMDDEPWEGFHGQPGFDFLKGRQFDFLGLTAWVCFLLGVGMMALFRTTLVGWVPFFVLSIAFATYNMLAHHRTSSYVLILASLVTPAILWFTFKDTQDTKNVRWEPPVRVERVDTVV